ncbi:MAG TPA: phage holin family protein [Bryobacteraceae bacterium]|nr:phage holin family protein [Bryobacteraceae bacterium]
MAIDDPGKAAGGKLGEYAYTGRPQSTTSERSTGDVLKDIIGNMQDIIRSEVRLARVEMKEETGKMFRAAAVLAAGAVLALYGLLFILLALVYTLTTSLSPAASALIVGVALAIVAGILVSAGRARLRKVSPKPEKTIDTVKENIEWLKGQTKS